MPRKTNIYKLDRRDIEEEFVLASVLGKPDVTTTIDHFCELFSIPLDQERIKSRYADLYALKQAILEAEKTDGKKAVAKK